MLQYVPLLEARGFEVTVQPMLDDAALLERYRRGRYDAVALVRAYARRMQALGSSGRFDIAWVEKEALPWLPATLERLLLRIPVVLDYDDAVFHDYDMHRSAWVRKLLGHRIDDLMRHAVLVVAGNDYLAARARAAGAARVERVPTVVDLRRYPAPDATTQSGLPRIAWIGSPSTLRYLRQLEVPLRELSAHRRFRLRVIGVEQFALSGVDVEVMPWREDAEAALLRECSIGVMPLDDGPWERGKCGYKLVQYMACGLPVVASPLQANVDIVAGGQAGFLAADAGEWEACLARLMDDAGLRQRLGANGRRRVEQVYSVQAQVERICGLLHEVAA
jgi:glycosyltransferase involved in cell wall biosynthesis